MNEKLYLKDVKEKLQIIEQIDDQRILTEIAINDDDMQVQDEAVEKIDDEHLLYKIITSNDKLWDPVLITAIRKITNEDYLVNIARKYRGDNIAKIAIQQIQDPIKLCEFTSFETGGCTFSDVVKRIVQSQNPLAIQKLKNNIQEVYTYMYLKDHNLI